MRPRGRNLPARQGGTSHPAFSCETMILATSARADGLMRMLSISCALDERDFPTVVVDSDRC